MPDDSTSHRTGAGAGNFDWSLHPTWTSDRPRACTQPEPYPEPSQRPGVATWRHGCLPQGGTPPYFYGDVLAQVLEHGRLSAHAGGMLVGAYRLGGAGPYVEVTGFAGAGRVRSNTGLAARLRTAYGLPPGPGRLGPVGWFHCRSAPGPAPTPEDLRIHTSVFSVSWALMLLIELVSHQVTLYQLQPGGPRDTGFHLVRPWPSQA